MVVNTFWNREHPFNSPAFFFKSGSALRPIANDKRNCVAYKFMNSILCCGRLSIWAPCNYYSCICSRHSVIARHICNTFATIDCIFICWIHFCCYQIIRIYCFIHSLAEIAISFFITSRTFNKRITLQFILIIRSLINHPQNGCLLIFYFHFISIRIHAIHRIVPIPHIQIRACKLPCRVHGNPHSKHRIQISRPEVVQLDFIVLSIPE